jgi:hypothetical protein
MRHLRSDYDAIQPFPQKRPHWVKIEGETVYAGDGTVENVNIHTLGKHMDPIIPEDEPVFILRGQDPSAGPAVRAWADDVEARGGDPVLVSRVRAWAKEMEMFARNNPKGMKQVADVPDGALR